MTISDTAATDTDPRRTLLTAIPRGTRLTGSQRELARQYVADRYRAFSSVRSIADELGRAYGTVHRLLVEAEVERRPRGGQSS